MKTKSKKLSPTFKKGDFVPVTSKTIYLIMTYKGFWSVGELPNDVNVTTHKFHTGTKEDENDSKKMVTATSSTVGEETKPDMGVCDCNPST